MYADVTDDVLRDALPASFAGDDANDPHDQRSVDGGKVKPVRRRVEQDLGKMSHGAQCDGQYRQRKLNRAEGASISSLTIFLGEDLVG